MNLQGIYFIEICTLSNNGFQWILRCSSLGGGPCHCCRTCPEFPDSRAVLRKTHLRNYFFSRERCKRLMPLNKLSFLLSCKPLRTIPQQFVAPEENNLINRSYCHKRSADYKNLIVRLVTMVPSHNNCNVSSFLSPSPTPTYQAAEKNRFTAKIELLSHSNWKYGTCTGAAGIIRAV